MDLPLGLLFFHPKSTPWQSKFSLRRETRGVTAHVLVRLKEYRTVVMVPYNLSRDFAFIVLWEAKVEKE